MRFNKNEAWSFGKSSKSKDIKNLNPGPGNYDSNYLGKSAPKWKLGEKHTYNNKDNFPGAGAYTIPSLIQTGPMYSLNKSTYKLKIPNNPSPLDYNPDKNKILKHYPAYSLRGKPEKKDNSISPGPNAYNVPLIHKGTRGYSLGKSMNREKLNTNPGPGDYNPKFDQKKGITFKGRYELKNKNNVPGPQYDYNYNNYVKKSPAYS